MKVKRAPDSSPEYNAAAYDSKAYEASAVAKVGACTLYGFGGHNSNASGQFVQIHDTTSLPANGAIPKLVVWVSAVGPFSLDTGIFGKTFLNGIVICNSTTGPTLTIGAADCFFNVLLK